MKTTTKKFPGKHIKFEKYDTVRIVTLNDCGHKSIEKGLFLFHGALLDSSYSKNLPVPFSVKIIIGSQRGARRAMNIECICGIKIMPTRMVLVEKLRSNRFKPNI